MKWNRVTVVGCGLIGASFALALRRAGGCARVAGWDSSESALAEALRRGIVDEADRSFADGETCPSDLVYLAMPVGEIVRFLRERGSQVKYGAVVTDAGSTKAQVCRAAREHLPAGRAFVGGHPVAGSQNSGPAHARPDLFEGAPYALVAEEGAEDGGALTAVRQTVEQLGARAVLTDPEGHDRALAFVSHLPQLLSSALAATLRERTDADALLDLAGAGYRDMTRLAASSWSVWRDILTTNPAPVSEALQALLEKLAAVRDELRAHSEGVGAELPAAGALFEKARRSQQRGE